MNILLISPLPPPAGGIASWTQKYLKNNKAAEHNVFIVNTAVIGKRVKEYNKRRISHEIKRIHNILTDLKKQLKKNRFDAVHLNCACGRFGSIIKDYMLAAAVKRNKTRLIAHFHCDLSDMINGKTDLLFFKRIVKMADVILALNERSANFIHRHCNRNSIIIPNFVSDDYFNSIPTERKSNDEIKSVLFAGHIQESKGCDVIYKTAQLFPEIQFTLLGYISDSFRNMAKPDNIKLTGEVPGEQVKAEMLKSDLLLFPTRTEGFPYVIIEAMACGLPIIATPVGAIPEIIENSGGILVPVNDVKAVAEAVISLQDKESRQQMADWNRQKVKCNYTAEKVMGRLFEIYHGDLQDKETF